MAFPNDLVLDDASGDDVTFTAVGSAERGASSRHDVSSTISTPRVLNIKHTQVGNLKDGIVDRHLVQVLHTVDGSSGAKQVSVNFTVTVPRDPAVTQQVVHDDVAIVVDLLTDGALVNPMTAVNLAKILRGEV